MSQKKKSTRKKGGNGGTCPVDSPCHKKGSGKSNGNGNGKSKSNGNARKPNRNRDDDRPPHTRPRNSPSAGHDPGAGMIIHRTSTSLTPQSLPSEAEAGRPRRTLSERVAGMGASHVVAAVGSGTAFTALSVTAVGQGWIGGKTSAGIMMGVGTATAAVGVYGEHDHLMMAGAGVAAAGAVSMANQLAVDGYEAVEKRAAERKAKKQAEKEAQEAAEKLAEARALVEAEDKKRRNAQRIVITDEYGNPMEFAMREASPGDHDEDAPN